jgi:hypothetical protein
MAHTATFADWERRLVAGMCLAFSNLTPMLAHPRWKTLIAGNSALRLFWNRLVGFCKSFVVIHGPAAGLVCDDLIGAWRCGPFEQTMFVRIEIDVRVVVHAAIEIHIGVEIHVENGILTDRPRR